MFPASSMPDNDWWHCLWSDPKSTIDSLELPRSTKIAVDLCCGNGMFTPYLSRFADTVYGIELSSELMEEAKNFCYKMGIGEKCSWIVGDAMLLPTYFTEKVDLIFMANTFHGIPCKEDMIRKMAEVLSPIGEIVIINWYRLSREDTVVLDKPRGPGFELRMNPDDVEKLFAPFGFVATKKIDVTPFHYAIVLKML